MATGEVVDAEALGGATMHSTVTGLSDQLAVDEYASTSIPWLLITDTDLEDLMQSEKLASGSSQLPVHKYNWRSQRQH
jgi:acetyl-CoA carboxylase carboxyltransferase component